MKRNPLSEQTKEYSETEFSSVRSSAGCLPEAEEQKEAAPSYDAQVSTWVLQAQKGDAEAFALLVTQYEKFVLHTAMRTLSVCGGRSADAEDVAQNAFLKAWRSLSAFRFECAFSSWLYRIAVNCARDAARAEQRHPTVSLSSGEEDDDLPDIDVPVRSGDEIPEEALERKETIQMVRRAVEALPHDMRQVVFLRDLEDLSYADIASLLHLELGTVKSRLNRARELLKKNLAGLR